MRRARPMRRLSRLTQRAGRRGDRVAGARRAGPPYPAGDRHGGSRPLLDPGLCGHDDRRDRGGRAREPAHRVQLGGRQGGPAQAGPGLGHRRRRRADSLGRPPGDQGDPGRVRPAEGTHALGADRDRRRHPDRAARRSSHRRSRYRPGRREVARRGEQQPDVGRYRVHPVSRVPGRTGRRHDRATCRGTLLGAHGRPPLPAAGRSARLEHADFNRWLSGSLAVALLPT